MVVIMHVIAITLSKQDSVFEMSQNKTVDKLPMIQITCNCYITQTNKLRQIYLSQFLYSFQPCNQDGIDGIKL